MTSSLQNYNKQLLTSISIEGLTASSERKNTPCITSKNVHSDSFLNLFFPPKSSFDAEKNWFENGLTTLIRSPANGFLPLTLERQPSQEKSREWIYFDTNQTSLSKKISSILCNSIVIECLFEKLPEPSKGYNFNSEWHGTGGCREFAFSKPIRPNAFVRAFIPVHLIALFQNCFPNLECIAVENSKQKCCLEIPEEITYDSEFQKTIKDNPTYVEFLTKIYCNLEIDLPNYAYHIENYMRSYFCDLSNFDKLASKKPLAFHVIRLASQFDIPFLNLKIDPDMPLSLSHLNNPLSYPILSIHHDAGWGNTLSIRGAWKNCSFPEEKTTLNLSWDVDLPLKCIHSGEWVLETDSPIQSSFEFKVIKKTQTDTVIWEKDTGNGNRLYNPIQNQMVIFPNFS